MSAWNYPLFTSLPALAQAIAAGNVALLKPSELSPSTSVLLKKLFDDYLDKECF
jgi:acyl-CoA reductase-like NAD-dependent aldehyde dehydrogenase